MRGKPLPPICLQRNDQNRNWNYRGERQAYFCDMPDCEMRPRGNQKLFVSRSAVALLPVPQENKNASHPGQVVPQIIWVREAEVTGVKKRDEKSRRRQ